MVYNQVQATSKGVFVTREIRRRRVPGRHECRVTILWVKLAPSRVRLFDCTPQLGDVDFEAVVPFNSVNCQRVVRFLSEKACIRPQIPARNMRRPVPCKTIGAGARRKSTRHQPGDNFASFLCTARHRLPFRRCSHHRCRRDPSRSDGRAAAQESFGQSVALPGFPGERALQRHGRRNNVHKSLCSNRWFEFKSPRSSSDR